eukprot:1882204-Prymnesium_polylepis.1
MLTTPVFALKTCITAVEAVGEGGGQPGEAAAVTNDVPARRGGRVERRGMHGRRTAAAGAVRAWLRRRRRGCWLCGGRRRRPSTSLARASGRARRRARRCRGVMHVDARSALRARRVRRRILLPLPHYVGGTGRLPIRPLNDTYL